MVTTVNEYVNSCDNCQKSKLSLPTRAPLLNTPYGKPLQMVQVDVLEVPLSSDGNRYLLVIEDSFTKWVEASPMKNQKSETISDLLVQTFSRLGIPELLHSDQGSSGIPNLENRTTKHTTTQVTPFQLMYGCDPIGTLKLDELTIYDPT